LAETGHVADAQRIILAELTKEFGGSAAAARNTLGGALQGLKNDFGDLFEVSSGGSAGLIALINRLDKGLLFLKDHINQVQAAVGAFFTAVAAGVAVYVALSLAIKAAAVWQGILTAVQTIQAFIQLIKLIRSAADAMALLSLVSKGAVGAIAAIAAMTVGYLAYRKIQRDLAAAAAEEDARLNTLITNTTDLTHATHELSEEEKKRIAQMRENEDIVRIASQQVQLARLDGDAQQKLSIQYDAVNKEIEARRHLQGDLLESTLAAIVAERNLRLQAVDVAHAFAEQQKKIAELKEVLQQYSDSVKDMFTSLFEDIFNGGIKKFSDLFAGIKQMFFKMLAEMASAQMMKLVGSSLAGTLAATFGGVSKLAAQAKAAGMQAAEKAASSVAGATKGATTTVAAASGSVPVQLTGISTDAQHSLLSDMSKYLGPAIGGFMAGQAVGGMTSNRALGTAGGALAGAATGALIGSVVPVVGTAVGAIVGGIAGAIGGFLGSSKKKAQEAAKKAEEERYRIEFAGNLRIRELQAQGKDDEAALMQLKMQQERDLAQARKDGILTTGQLKHLEQVQAMERAKFIEDQKKRAAEEAKQKETERKAAVDNMAVRALQAQGLAAEADDLQFLITQQNELNQAIDKWGDSNPEIIKQLGELMSAERAYRAEQKRLAEVSFREDLLARRLSALGLEDEAAAVALLAQQRKDLAAAKGSGVSQQGLDELAAVQLLERLALAAQQAAAARAKAMQALEDELAHVTEGINAQIQAIQDASAKAIAGFDAQIDAVKTAASKLDATLKAQQDAIATAAAKDAKIRQQEIDAADAERSILRSLLAAQLEVAKADLDVARGQLDAAQSSVDQLAQVTTSLRDFLGNLLLDSQTSVLSPSGMLAEAQQQFATLLAKAQGGDRNAAESLPQAGRSLLEAARTMFASSPNYVDTFRMVEEAIRGVEAQYADQLTTEEKSLAVLQEQVKRLESLIAVLEKVGDSTSEQVAAARAQLAAINSNADRQIAAVDRTSATASQQIAAIEAARAAATANANALISLLTAHTDTQLAEAQAALAAAQISATNSSADKQIAAANAAADAQRAAVNTNADRQIAAVDRTSAAAVQQIAAIEAARAQQLAAIEESRVAAVTSASNQSQVDIANTKAVVEALLRQGEVNRIGEQISEMQAQKEAAAEAAQAQIDELERQRAEAAAAAQSQVDALTALRNAVKEDAEKQIGLLEAQLKEITAGYRAQIEAIRTTESDAERVLREEAEKMKQQLAALGGTGSAGNAMVADTIARLYQPLLDQINLTTRLADIGTSQVEKLEAILAVLKAQAEKPPVVPPEPPVPPTKPEKPSLPEGGGGGKVAPAVDITNELLTIQNKELRAMVNLQQAAYQRLIEQQDETNAALDQLRTEVRRTREAASV
jgi:hypothetical protein